jgi:hypothetical protein
MVREVGHVLGLAEQSDIGKGLFEEVYPQRGRRVRRRELGG